ncbi:LINE-1 reverse transcriptase-like protein [Elysia marginata]|uniref:LINE-1 reverse transcriptase-like protein n=1 Tax=Elysia marginata TaxID=1093978 RepID=A0AAV4F9G7_9GAST|nr:LINE-1 reverse transcriptase-like protein [Elysia marginata]
MVEEAERTGLRINISKTESMGINNNGDDPLRLHEKKCIKDAEKFVYLVSAVSKSGGPGEEIKCGLNKVRQAFNTLRQISRSTTLILHNEIRIFKTNVKSALLYGSDTWRMTKTSTRSLQAFINRCHRNFLNVR